VAPALARHTGHGGFPALPAESVSRLYALRDWIRWSRTLKRSSPSSIGISILWSSMSGSGDPTPIWIKKASPCRRWLGSPRESAGRQSRISPKISDAIVPSTPMGKAPQRAGTLHDPRDHARLPRGHEALARLLQRRQPPDYAGTTFVTSARQETDSSTTHAPSACNRGASCMRRSVPTRSSPRSPRHFRNNATSTAGARSRGWRGSTSRTA
jgi:hypothetical protein